MIQKMGTGKLYFDFGLVEFGVRDETERLRRYRRYVYEAGAVVKPGNRTAGVIDEEILEKERANDFNVDKVRRVSVPDALFHGLWHHRHQGFRR